MNEKSLKFKRLDTVNEALNILYNHFDPAPKGTERLPLRNLSGRVLAENLSSKVSVPQFDRAKMDGWALRASDVETATETNPVYLKIAGKVEIGRKPRVEVDSNEAVEISTGAMLPRGANAVVMKEYSERNEEKVKIYQSVAPGENIQERASDIAYGDILLRQGCLLSPREVAAIAAMGKKRVKVFEKPELAVLSLGDELTEPGRSLKFGKIYDINSYSLLTSIKEVGGKIISHERVKDQPKIVKEELKAAAEKADLILTSGATSVGGGDFLPELLQSLKNSRLLAHGLKVKPGKPTMLGLIKGIPYFALPGHPVSCLTIFRELVEPVLRKMAALPLSPEDELQAVLKKRVSTPEGRKYLTSVALNRSKGKIVATPIPGGSGTITNLLKADGYLSLSPEREYQPKDTQVTVKLLSHKTELPDLTLATEYSPTVNLLTQQIYKNFPELQMKVLRIGGVRSIIGVKRGEFTVGGICLFDKEKGSFNFPFLRRFDPEQEISLITGIYREVGIVFNKNSVRLSALMDLIQKDMKFLNRDLESGARGILDREIKRLAGKKGVSSKDITSKINGYEETSSDISIAVGASKGRIDAGLSTRYLADKFNLGFLPVGKVKVDFILTRPNSKSVEIFRRTLKSPKFKDLIRNERGLMLREDTGTIQRT